MMQNVFRNHFAVLQYSPTNLPFTVGGAIQSGRHSDDEMNNQDAAGIFVGESSIIGVVSDGCGGASQHGKNICSLNETGAQLSCILAINMLQNLLRNHSLEEPETFIKEFDKRFLKRLRGLSMLAGRSREMRSHLLFEFFMSTLLGFVLTEENFIIFGAGDGVIGINGEIQKREDFSE